MTTQPPVWIQILLASVPLLAAIIAGIFALTNTVGRRIERLKNLTELHKNYPPELNPNNALEIAMLRELRALESVITPTHKWDKRIHVWAALGLMTGLGLGLFGYFSDKGILLPIAQLVITVSSFAIFISVVWLNLHLPPMKADRLYAEKIKALQARSPTGRSDTSRET
ncbi:Uncharacterised protein [Mycolicibacterium phlei]|uniref:hypothetical protein n=1 Tax=Mycobacteroides chelonae TaxID=1774 RepID=UPI000618D521|nr:hypothetical protein [Mycobacteroides chelonae]VEG17716.1 Uncharacterised protein [Mycolicibacterium phlei]AKC39420.1 hypothetical protein GR01_13815 [Mycobacteroides chelonae]ANB00931.1 hypothetical protein BB28_14650 [Mycobacteroides chelonae CCUG 47445]OLT72624.1 hypothetical protein BKG56_21750 [Mycobacteroides chelonae]ORV11952.1 hypothetical protein AWB96_21675 [Mycobacteroides chelonae]